METSIKLDARKSFFRLFSPQKRKPVSSGDVVLEPIYPRSYDLNYTSLLVPCRNIQLEGALAVLLVEGLQQVCGEHGWQIEFVTVTRDYLQWGLQVVPSIQAAQFMKEIRSRTSEMALSRFAHLCGENPNEFWAPGYLAVLGAQPHSNEMIEQYIARSRCQQASSA
jgi:REP element-mobilizing transposase RayT